MQNLFIINRIEHIELEESVDSIIYSQNRIFVVFVRVHRIENTTSHETHSEQWARVDSALSKIKDIRRSNSQEFMNLTNDESDEHTICSMSMRQIWRSRNESRASNELEVEQEIIS